MTPEQILETYRDLFVQQNFLWIVLMPLLWGIAKFFHATIVVLEDGLDKILTFNGFFENEGFKSIMDVVMPIAMALFAIALIYVGYLIMSGKGIKKSDIVTNAILASCLMIGIPYITTTLNGLSTDFVQAGRDAGTTTQNEKLGTQIVATNTFDLLHMARKTGWKKDEETFLNNNITTDNFYKKDFTGVINASEEKKGIEEAGDYNYKLTGDERNVFAKKIMDKEDGSTDLVEIKPADFPFIGQVSFLNSWYYRYHANFFTMYMQFIVVCFVLIFAMFKAITLMMEIAFLNIIAPWIAATDLTTGQKMKQLVTNLIMAFATIGILMFVIKLYMLAMTYISTLGWSPWLVAIAMLALGKFVLDGPEEAKRLLGIDVGVKDGYQALMGTLAAGGAVVGAGKMLSGKAKGMKESLQEMRDKKEKSEGLAGKIGERGANAINKMAGTAGEISEVGLKGFATNATKEGIEKSKDALNSKLDSVKSAVTSNSATEAFNEGKEKAKQYSSSSSESVTTGTTPDSRNAINKVMEDNGNMMSTAERTVLEKVVRDEAPLTNGERQILERLSGSASISEADRDSIRNVLEQTAGQTLGRGDSTAIENILTQRAGDLSTEDRTALERLIQQPGSVTAEDRTAIERMLRDPGNSLTSQDRTAIERVLHQDSGQMNAQDRTAIERVISQNAGNISAEDRTAMERIISQGGVQTAQDRTAVERVLSQTSGNLTAQDRTAMERLIQQPTAGTSTADRTAIERVISQNAGNISAQDRTAMERIISNPTQATAQDRTAFERVLTQHSGNMTASQRTAFENINQMMGTPLNSTSSGNVTQSVNQVTGTQIPSSGGTPVNRSINEVQGSTVSGSHNSGLKRVDEVFGNKVSDNNKQPVTVRVNETASSTIRNNNSAMNRTVNETKGSSIGGSQSPLNRTVNETKGSGIGGSQSPLNRPVNETKGSSIGTDRVTVNRTVNEVKGTSVESTKNLKSFDEMMGKKNR